QGDGGTASGFTGNNSGDTQHVIGVGASYTGEYEGIGIKTSVVGEFGKSESALMEDTNAWQAGIVLSNQGFSLAGSYGDWGESGTLVGLNNSTDFWTLGAAYESGPVGVSATYISSEREKNKYSNLVVGADMQLAPGLTPYMEASFFDADQASTTVDNSGTVLMMGSYINF
ncbi:MAG: porin, partial [Rickettsiales bacterium]|nr:porin [Rickettsiales bacterium]